MLRACEQAIVLSLWIKEALTASLGFLGGSVVNNPPAIQEPQETQVQSLGWEDPLEEGMAAHSSILTIESPCTEEPSGLQSMASQRVRHD